MGKAKELSSYFFVSHTYIIIPAYCVIYNS